jgi:hypothetical protein
MQLTTLFIPILFLVALFRWMVTSIFGEVRLFNFLGAKIDENSIGEGYSRCHSHKKDACPVCILLPNQKAPVKRVGLDIGK